MCILAPARVISVICNKNKNNHLRVNIPKPKKSFLAYLGPSIILVALSVSGGEMLLWPSLVTNYGLDILWPVPIILLLQYFVNIEIERYALVTGRSTGNDLLGKYKVLAPIFAITILAALVWPAWFVTAANLTAFVFGWEGSDTAWYGAFIASAFLLIAYYVFNRKQTYYILERVAKVGLILALLIIIFVVYLRFDFAMFMQGVRGLFEFGYVPDNIDRFAFVGALAYGGVAGVLNLVQADWVRGKGYGVNSLTRREIRDIDHGSHASRANFRLWFKIISKEHFFLYVLGNLVSIFLLAYLGSLLLPQGSTSGFGVLINEILVLNNFFPSLGYLFAISGISIFFMANLTILDAIGRLSSGVLLAYKKSKYFDHNFISRIACLIGIAILMLSIFIPEFKQPFFLLLVSAVLSAGTMWLYPPLLIRLNRTLPQNQRPANWRSLILILCALFYGFVTLWSLSQYLNFNFVIILGIVVTVIQYLIVRD